MSGVDEWDAYGAAGVFAARRSRGHTAAGSRRFRRGDSHRQQTSANGQFRSTTARLPWASTGHPEVAFRRDDRAGRARRRHRAVTKRDPFGANSRARYWRERTGCEGICEKRPNGGAGRLLGLHMAGPWVTEQAGAGVPVGELGSDPREISTFVQPHPTLSETFGETVLALTGGACTLPDITMPQLGETVTEGRSSAG